MEEGGGATLPCIEEEARLRRDLALACRVLGAAGHGDALYGHISARLPGWDRFWMKPAGLGLEEMTEDDLILIDLEGRVLSGSRPRHREYPIHAEVMRARADVNAVVHTHPRHGIALPARGLRLARVGQDGDFFVPGVPVFDGFTHLVTTRSEGEAVAAVLAGARAAFLINHGVVVVGPDVPEVTCAALMLERACEIQLLAQPSPGYELREAPPDEALAVAEIRGADMRAVFEYHVRRLGAPGGR